MNLLVSEILGKVSKLKTKKEKVAWLKQHDSDGLRMVIKSSFDPELNWLLPEGDVPFNRNDAPEGLQENDADVLVAAKDKSLHRKYKGLSDNVVREAFDWDESYMKVDGYPQRPGPASG